MLKAYIPVTSILDPFFNSMSPLNITKVTFEEFLISSDAVNLQLAPLQFFFSMDGTVVSISSSSPLSNIRDSSGEKVRRINLRY